MMASKFLYDEGVDEEVFNDDWANSVDIETEDVNQMERDFLSAIVRNIYAKSFLIDFQQPARCIEKLIYKD